MRTARERLASSHLPLVIIAGSTLPSALRTAVQPDLHLPVSVASWSRRRAFHASSAALSTEHNLAAGTSIRILGLLRKTTEEELIGEFGRFGTIEHISVKKTGSVRNGFLVRRGTYIQFADELAAREAAAKMDKALLFGRPLRVMWVDAMDGTEAVTILGKDTRATTMDAALPLKRFKFSFLQSVHVRLDSLIVDVGRKWHPRELRSALRDIGGILRVRVCIDQETTGFGGSLLVQFNSGEQARAASEVLRTREILGKKLVVHYALPPSVSWNWRSKDKPEKLEMEDDRKRETKTQKGATEMATGEGSGTVAGVDGVSQKPVNNATDAATIAVADTFTGRFGKETEGKAGGEKVVSDGPGAEAPLPEQSPLSGETSTEESRDTTTATPDDTPAEAPETGATTETPADESVPEHEPVQSSEPQEGELPPP